MTPQDLPDKTHQPARPR